MCLQPGRGPTGSAGGIDDEVGSEVFSCDVSGSDRYSFDGRRRGVREVLEERTGRSAVDLAVCRDVLTNQVLEDRPRCAVHQVAVRPGSHEIVLEEDVTIASAFTRHAAGVSKHLTEPRERVFERGPATLPQHVWMGPLWDSSAWFRVVGERITVENRDLVEGIRKDELPASRSCSHRPRRRGHSGCRSDRRRTRAH